MGIEALKTTKKIAEQQDTPENNRAIHSANHILTKIRLDQENISEALAIGNENLRKVIM